MDISHLRNEYTRAGLRRADLAANPYAQFDLWFRQANEGGLQEPNAMAVATATAQGAPSMRTVLLKAWDEKGFVFFTNYDSRKACEIAENPQVALLFMWLPFERQVKIRGTAHKVTKAESLKYFLSRPHGSQLGAWVSNQSSIVSTRKIMEQKLDAMRQRFAKGEVPLPPAWGGYRVEPNAIEFWQGGEKRLHDRFQYSRDDRGDWQLDRLAP